VARVDDVVFTDLDAAHQQPGGVGVSGRDPQTRNGRTGSDHPRAGALGSSPAQDETDISFETCRWFGHRLDDR
jgi:hypothetical protein